MDNNSGVSVSSRMPRANVAWPTTRYANGMPGTTMALCLMARQFMLEERMLQKESLPMLSHSDRAPAQGLFAKARQLTTGGGAID